MVIIVVPDLGGNYLSLLSQETRTWVVSCPTSSFMGVSNMAFERHHPLNMYLNYDGVKEGSLLVHNFRFIVLERLTKIIRR